MEGNRHRRLVLAGVLGLLLVTEMALGPYYPQLFRDVYGETEPSDTGIFVWATRLSAMVALPLLGLLARRIGAGRVVTGGLAVAVVGDVLLPFAPDLTTFTVISAVSAASGSALLLAYPALVGMDDEHAAPGVVWFAGLFHGAVILAAATGAIIVALPDPRIGLAAFAPVTLVLLLLSRRAMAVGHGPHENATGPAGEPEPDASQVVRAAAGGPAAPPSGDEAAGPGRIGGSGDRRRGVALAVLPALVGFALVATVLDFSMAVVRPFFVSALEEDGRGAVLAAALFLLPSVAALATLPLVGRATARWGRALLPLGLVVAAGALALQAAAASDLVALVSGRLAFGAGVVLAQIEVDRRIFAVAGVAGPGFAASETARGLGLVLAPLTAAAAAESDLLLPLGVGAAGLACAAGLALLLMFLSHPARKASRVPST